MSKFVAGALCGASVVFGLVCFVGYREQQKGKIVIEGERLTQIIDEHLISSFNSDNMSRAGMNAALGHRSGKRV